MKPLSLPARALSLLILASLVLAACTTVAPTAEPSTAITVTDALGRTVTLPQPPGRIVLAGRGVALIADSVYLFPNAASLVAAVSNTSQGTGEPFLAAVDPDFPAKVQFETNVGAEQVAAARPDLVILKSYLQESLGTPLEALGIPVVYLDLETPEQFTRDLATLGILLQQPDRAAELAAYYRDAVAAVQAPLQDLPADGKPRVLLLYYTDRDGEVAFNVPPAAWLQTLMVDMAGGTPAWSDIELGSGWTKVSFEQIAAWDADRIFIIRYTGSAAEVVDQLAADPQWQELRAVQAGGLTAFPRDYYSWDQPNPRWILGLQWLAAELHPQAFPQFKLADSARQFFRFAYRLDDSAFDRFITPSMETSSIQ